jgi:uncharacterized protein
VSTLTMTAAEREAFLAQVHVGVLSVAAADGAADGARGPLTMPIWYRYEPGGDVTFFTGQTTRKMRLLREAGRCSLCAQDEAPPYKYVTVEGQVTFERETLAQERRLMAHRYLGPEAGEGWLAATEGEVASYVVVHLRPEHWLTADFGKLGVGG